MDTNELCDKSTGNADNEAGLRTMSGQGLTPHERAIGVLLAEAWNLYLRVEGRDHEADGIFRKSINRAQDVLALRVARRVDPDFWNTPVEVTMAVVSADSKCPDCGKDRRHDYHAGEPCDECVDRLVARPPVEESAFTWQCVGCGQVNGIHRDACPKCGMGIYKSQAAADALSTTEATPPAERPTPETDEVFGPELFGIRARTCRRLERQLAEALELIAVKDRSLNAANQTIMLNNELMRQAIDKIAEAREQRDRLADALRSIRKQVRGTARHDATIECISIITETALDAVKE